MKIIDAEQMANDEDIAYHNACKKITDEVNAGVNYAVHYKIQKLIADTPELPTMQSNDICDYCLMASLCHAVYNDRSFCNGRDFRGKKVIEVADEN